MGKSLPVSLVRRQTVGFRTKVSRASGSANASDDNCRVNYPRRQFFNWRTVVSRLLVVTLFAVFRQIEPDSLRFHRGAQGAEHGLDDEGD